MNRNARIFLMTASAACSAFVASAGSGFSRMAEPDEYTSATSLFWLASGLLVALPLWFPALIPNRFANALLWARRACGCALLIPTYMFSTIVIHNVSRQVSGIGMSVSAFAIGLALMLACLIALFVLLWPDAQALFRTTGRSGD
jgi:hypothetical protein